MQRGLRPNKLLRRRRCFPGQRRAPHALFGLFGSQEKRPEEPVLLISNKQCQSTFHDQEIVALCRQVEPGLSPPFTTLRAGPVYDLRVYGVYTVARTDYSTRPEARPAAQHLHAARAEPPAMLPPQGLARLASYFDGGNEEGALLASTQPLTMRYAPQPGGELLKRMELYCGSRRGASAAGGAAAAPLPSVEGVELAAAGAEAVAALQVLGSVTAADAEARRAQLLAALQADGVAVHQEDRGGGFRIAQFGPLYSLKPRKNELLIRVQLSNPPTST